MLLCVIWHIYIHVYLAASCAPDIGFLLYNFLLHVHTRQACQIHSPVFVHVSGSTAALRSRASLRKGGPSSRALPPSPPAERPLPHRERERERERSPVGRSELRAGHNHRAERRRPEEAAPARPRTTIRSQVIVRSSWLSPALN
jgi:hypothetical protein